MIVSGFIEDEERYLMEKELDVFCVVVSPIASSSLSCLLSAFWLSWVYTLEDAQSSKISERELKFGVKEENAGQNLT